LKSSLNTEDFLVGLSVMLTVVGIILGAVFTNPRFIGYTALVVITLLIGGGCILRSSRLSWLLLYGLISGILELWSDWIHVTRIGSLVYTDYFGLRLLASPLYMPIGWWLTVVQFGYLALRLRERWPAWKAVAAVTALGMSLPPWYEELAAPAKAWYYPPSAVMLSHTPLWIIFTYGGCMFSIGTMTLLNYSPGAWGRAVVGGFFTGVGFMLSGIVCFALLG
jgi:hypothetical protein